MRPQQRTGLRQFDNDGVNSPPIGVAGFFFPARGNPLDDRGQVPPRIRGQYPHDERLSEDAGGVVQAFYRRFDLDVTRLRRLKIEVRPAFVIGLGHAQHRLTGKRPGHWPPGDRQRGVKRRHLNPQPHPLAEFKHRVISRLQDFTKHQSMVPQRHADRVRLCGVPVVQDQCQEVGFGKVQPRASDLPFTVKRLIDAPFRRREHRTIGVVFADQRHVGA